MTSLYTERFADYLNRNGYTDSQGTFIPSVPTDCRELFEHFPKFKIDESLTIDFYEMFKQYNETKEIGAETEQLFTHYLKRTLQESIINYIPKINLFLNNFNDKLLARKLELTSTANNTYEVTNTDSNSGNMATKDFLNPVSDDTSVLQGKTTNDSTSSRNSKENGNTSTTATTERAYSWFKSNADLLRQALELKNIYLEALHSFDKLFMYTL